MLSKDERLRARRDFHAVFGRKKSWANPLLVLNLRFYDRNGADAETRRFGFSVSKKAVGKAHDRNRVKRRLREICRLNAGGWRRGFDAVIVARSGAASATFPELETALRGLVERAGLLSQADSRRGDGKARAELGDGGNGADSGNDGNGMQPERR